MTNTQIMKKHLEEKVIRPLKNCGFVGKYPHFRKEKDGCIELISFQSNKYGNSFTVELSVIFPDNKEKNFNSDCDLNVNEITVFKTNERCRLKGMYDGWFYTCDLYSKYVFGFGKVYFEAGENGTSVPKGYKLVQKFDENKADCICSEINKQLTKAFKWMEKFERRVKE